MKRLDRLNIVSLFANVGVAETYLHTDRFKIALANEIDPKRVDYYRHMYPKTLMISGDITNKQIYEKIVKKMQLLNCNFILAGPPCQGISTAGKRDPKDQRNYLFKYVITMIDQTQTPYCLIENVPALAKLLVDNIPIDQWIKKQLPRYHVVIHTLNCANYGVPQNRKRCFIFISRKQWKPIVLPKKQSQITVKDAIAHLPDLESGETSSISYHYAKKHNPEHIEYLKYTPTGQSALKNTVHFPKKNGRRIKGFSTCYKRIDWDKPAPTITMCNGMVSSQNNIHPGKHLGGGGL